MDRIEFRNLLRRYLDNQCTDAEQHLVNQLYDLIEDSRTPAEWSDTEGLEEQMWANIEAQTFNKNNTQEQHEKLTARTIGQPLRKLINPWIGRAAAFLLVAVSAWWFFGRSNNAVSTAWTDTTANKPKEIVNNSLQAMTVTMEDGSTAILQSGSHLFFPEHFATDKREVSLTGQAFFNIAKNSARPFLIYTGNVVTRVLGTSFWVKNTEGGTHIEVEVKTGKVSVFKRQNIKDNHTIDKTLGNDGVVLTPNQKVQYFNDKEVFVTGLVAKPQLLEMEHAQEALPNFKFNETNLSDVILELEKAYGIQIVLSNDALNNCPVTGNLTKQALFDQLTLICGSLNANFEIKGTTILVNGRGCN